MPPVTPPERAPARRRAAALAGLVVLAGACAAPVDDTTPVDPIELRGGGADGGSGVEGAEPVPLPAPQPAGERDDG